MTRPAESSTADRLLTPDEVLAIVRSHVPAARSLTGIDESGRKGRAYLIDEGVVLKTQRPERLRGRMVEEFETSLAKEALFLRQMEAGGIAAGPRLLGYGLSAGVEYVCMTRLHGARLRDIDAADPRRLRALHGLGEVLARIHSLPQAPFRKSGLFPADAEPQALRSRMAVLFGNVADAVDSLPPDARPRAGASGLAERALALLPASLASVALHSNPAPEHVFVDEHGAFAGLIDFADAYISHPAFDLRPYRRPHEREAVLAGYAGVRPVDEAFIAAAKVTMLLGELANITRRRQPIAESEAIIEELLAW